MSEAKVIETHGPFNAYTEVSCKRGTFGLQPGKVLQVLEDGVQIVDAGEVKQSKRRSRAKADAEAKAEDTAEE